jgi:hypothetical protein
MNDLVRIEFVAAGVKRRVVLALAFVKAIVVLLWAGKVVMYLHDVRIREGEGGEKHE